MHIYASITFLLLIILPGQSQTKYTTVNGRRLVMVTDDVVCECSHGCEQKNAWVVQVLSTYSYE